MFLSVHDDRLPLKDEVSLLRPVGLARLRGVGRGGGGGGDVLEGADRVVRRMKIEPSSGGEEIHLRRLREEIRGGSDPLQEIAREASSHALPRRGGKLQKAGNVSLRPPPGKKVDIGFRITSHLL